MGGSPRTGEREGEDEAGMRYLREIVNRRSGGPQWSLVYDILALFGFRIARLFLSNRKSISLK